MEAERFLTGQKINLLQWLFTQNEIITVKL